MRRHPEEKLLFNITILMEKPVREERKKIPKKVAAFYADFLLL